MSAIWLTIQQIAEAVGAEVDGDGDVEIRGVASIESAGPDDLTFAVDPRRASRLRNCRAAAALVGETVDVPAGMTVLRVSDPEAAIAAVLGMIATKEDLPPVGVHPTAVIDATASLGTAAAIGPHVVVGPAAAVGDRVVLAANVSIGAGVTIGEDTVLHPGVVVGRGCRIGRRCRLYPNAVIGADGFGFFHRQGVHHRIPHAGAVHIGDDVEIGACTCVDRAKFGATTIGDGSKLDNLVHIAHNVQLGRGGLVAALVGIAGSATIGDYVVFGGHAGVRDNVSIGDGVQVAAYGAVAQDAAPGQVLSGIFAIPIQQHLRSAKVYAKLPELWRDVRRLQARLDALEREADNHSTDG